MKSFLVYTMIAIMFIASCFGVWLIKRNMNYSLFYSSSVENTIKKMVKPECLK